MQRWETREMPSAEELVTVRRETAVENELIMFFGFSFGLSMEWWRLVGFISVFLLCPRVAPVAVNTKIRKLNPFSTGFQRCILT